MFQFTITIRTDSGDPEEYKSLSEFVQLLINMIEGWTPYTVTLEND